MYPVTAIIETYWIDNEKLEMLGNIYLDGNFVTQSTAENKII